MSTKNDKYAMESTSQNIPVVLHDNGRVVSRRSGDRDKDELARTGKKQVLKRNFGLMSMLGFCCTVLGTWEGQLITFTIGFTNGGPAGFVYGYIIVWIGTLSIFITLSELASFAPTSGGQYHWVARLSPPSCRKVLSYITGWLTVCGWQAGVVSSAYISGTMIQGLIILNNADYIPKLWHGALLTWLVLLVAIFSNTIIARALPTIEATILILHILGFFAIIIPLVCIAPHGDASSVFVTWLNEGGWSTQGLSFFVGLTGTVFSFLGADGVIHMSEEIQNASVIVPRAIVWSIVLNGVLGFGMLIAVLFCIGDINTVLNAPYIYPYIEIFVQGTGNVGASTGMAVIIIVLAFCTTIAVLASSSRMTWAFARDRGLPGWQSLSKVYPSNSIPLYSVCLTTIISALLSLIAIGSPTALNDLISLAINAWYSSYLLASALLLWHRLRGTLHIPTSDLEASPSAEAIVTNTELLYWGPWRIPGILGTINNVVAVLFMIMILFWSFWSSTTPTTPQTMNYSSLVTGSVAIFSAVYYYVWGRKSYSGPVVEIF